MMSLPPFACPRCKQTNTRLMRRGPLNNTSHFLPKAERGKRPSRKIHMHCLHCGYIWRSESKRLASIMEEPNREGKYG